MLSYIARRLAFGAFTVVGVSIVVFVVMRILPGDPLVAIFGPEGFTKLTDKERAHYMAELGLSDPLVVQYLNWVKDIIRGEFGRSFFRSESVAEMIWRRGPLTAEIGILSVVLSWLVGIPVAVVSALRPNSLSDNTVRLMSILFLAIPGFWLGMLIVLALLFWFGYRAPLAGASLLADPWTNLQIVIGPAIVLGAWPSRLRRTHGSFQPARGHSRGLHTHGPRQGSERPARHRLSRPAKCTAAGHHIVRHPTRVRAGGIDPGRARLRHPRARLRDAPPPSASATCSSCRTSFSCTPSCSSR